MVNFKNKFWYLKHHEGIWHFETSRFIYQIDPGGQFDKQIWAFKTPFWAVKIPFLWHLIGQFFAKT